ncbi:MAG: hypothetical protein LBP87_10195 [Planctomycetaceae bacterium]|jgi:hypothetical protein|nr:hypothetical protein [Planctomycetaceae bacterium]
MTAKYFFNQKSFGFVILFFALCLFVIVGTETKSNANNETVYNNDSFQQQLLERSQKYLNSIRHRSANLSPELQKKLKIQTQNTVCKGLAKLNHSAKLLQKQANPVDLTVFSNAVQKIEKNQAIKVAAFLSCDFHRVTELEVVLRVAFPMWNYRQYGQFTAKNSDTLFGLAGRDVVNGTAIIAPVSPRNSKTFAKILVQLVSVLSIKTESFSYRFANDNILSGFILIAQTVIQRK